MTKFQHGSYVFEELSVDNEIACLCSLSEKVKSMGEGLLERLRSLMGNLSFVGLEIEVVSEKCCNHTNEQRSNKVEDTDTAHKCTDDF